MVCGYQPNQEYNVCGAPHVSYFYFLYHTLYSELGMVPSIVQSVCCVDADGATHAHAHTNTPTNINANAITNTITQIYTCDTHQLLCGIKQARQKKGLSSEVSVEATVQPQLKSRDSMLLLITKADSEISKDESLAKSK